MRLALCSEPFNQPLRGEKEKMVSQDSVYPKVYGSVKYKNFALKKEQRERIEKEAFQGVVSRFKEDAAGEIQYWVEFEQESPEEEIHCHVEVFSGFDTWESSEYSLDPLKSLKRCLAELQYSFIGAA